MCVLVCWKADVLGWRSRSNEVNVRVTANRTRHLREVCERRGLEGVVAGGSGLMMADVCI